MASCNYKREKINSFPYFDCRDTREIRYDPTDPNSSRLEVQSKEPIKKTKKKKVVDVQGEVVMPEVSSEKYYEVSENLKDRFTNTNKADSQTAVFSLLSMFDGNSGRAAETKNGIYFLLFFEINW